MQRVVDEPEVIDPVAGADGVDRRVVAAAVGLSVAGVLPPIAVAMIAGTDAARWRPLAAGALIALLVLAPAGVGLATALVGLRRIAASAARAAGEAEHAVLRVFAATLLFGYGLFSATFAPLAGAAADCLSVAAPGLVGAWALLLCVILWPVAPAVRRYGAMAFDIALLSSFLHLGGGAVAAWYPVYLVETFYAGLRFGLGALLLTTVGSVLGFAAVVLTTDSWQQSPVLAAGLVGALAALPAMVALAIRGMAMARGEAAETEADRQRTLMLIAETLRSPATPARSAASAAPPVADIVDFAALEAGTFAPPVETFDLRALARRGLAPLRTSAAARGAALRWRIDPRLPFRLRGHGQAFERILRALAEHAIDTAPAVSVRIAFDFGDSDGQTVWLRLRVEGLGEHFDLGLGASVIPLTLQLVQRLAALLGGEFVVERPADPRSRLVLTLPFAIEEGAAIPALDLRGRTALIASESGDLARLLVTLLTKWNADPLWPGGAEAALAGLSRLDATRRPVVLVDAREKLLSALSLVHHAARRSAGAPFVVLIAEPAQIGSLGELDEEGLNALIPSPVSEPLLANALYTLVLDADAPTPREADALQPTPGPAMQIDIPDTDGERITPIAVHPKFAAETAAAIDTRVIDELRALGGGPNFVHEVAETFRADAGQILKRLAEAAAAVDVGRFARGLVALHRAAGHLGGAQLCALAASLQHATPSELRQHGETHLQRLAAEVERLAAALTEALPAREARRP